MRQLIVEIGVVVPRGVIQVDEAHAAFDEPAGEQAVGGEGVELPLAAAALGLDVRLRAVDAVVVERLACFRFARSISSGAADCMRKANS